jgi:hypothetical protein
MNSERLKDFRQAAYDLLVLAKDATFELMDAVMTTRNAACLAEFSLNPLFNRQWPSVYEALQDCRPDRKKLMELYIKQLQQQVPATEHILVAIDRTVWGRPDAQTLKDRTHEYQGGVIMGQGYSTLPGYLKLMEVGHYPYSMNELVVGLHPYFRQLPNSNLSVNRASTQYYSRFHVYMIHCI